MAYFTPESFAFLRELSENSNRDWFTANKKRYESESATRPAFHH
jgi:uncharacterized protein (DUF2461 family)